MAGDHSAEHTRLVSACRLECNRHKDLWIAPVRNGKPAYGGAALGWIEGAADLCGFMSPNARFIALEMKTGKGVLSYEQKKFRDIVRSYGGFFAVIRDAAQIPAALARARSGALE
jgi:hypothetical protein